MPKFFTTDYDSYTFTATRKLNLKPGTAFTSVLIQQDTLMATFEVRLVDPVAFFENAKAFG